MDGVNMALGNSQMNDGGGCATMRERYERVESPGAYVSERVYVAIFAWPHIFSEGPPVIDWLSSGEGWDAVT